MTKLPPLPWNAILKKLEKFGYEVIRQKGSHMTLKSSFAGKKPVTLPRHKTVGRGLLRKILHDAKIDPEEFKNL